MGSILSTEQMQSALQAVLNPIAKAQGLPNACYTSEEYFEQEKKVLFRDSWACLGVAKDVPNLGDYKPYDYVGIPLLMLRDEDGVVKVFHNICSHRGMILVEEAGNSKGVLRCPYHSWCYALSGELKMTPHVGGPGHNKHEEFDRKAHGLKEVSSQVWMGMVFVNVSGTAQPFSSYIGKLEKRWAEFMQAPLLHGENTSFKLEINTNWKLAVENYCEAYHLPWIHPGLNSYSRLEDHYNIEDEDLAGQGSYVYKPILSSDGRALPKLPNLSKQWLESAEYIALFPNVLLGVCYDHFFTIVLEPKGPSTTVEHVELFYYDETAVGADYAEHRQKNFDGWKE
ncbi:MAG: aromatic ring-hydroxylating oxygenase subunit alpha, partial [Alphaproteobacteria bacterium]